jgi:hypothetical protein
MDFVVNDFFMSSWFWRLLVVIIYLGVGMLFTIPESRKTKVTILTVGIIGGLPYLCMAPVGASFTWGLTVAVLAIFYGQAVIGPDNEEK